MMAELEITADGAVRQAAGDPDRFDAFIPSPCVQNHAANLMPLANGDLACVWFGGTQEGMSDISVYFSRLPRGATQWSAAEKLSDDSGRSEQNPVLFPAPDGTLWLMWTAQLAGMGSDRDAISRASRPRHLHPPADRRARQWRLAVAGVLLPQHARQKMERR
jgi:predicted neuraminidase